MDSVPVEPGCNPVERPKADQAKQTAVNILPDHALRNHCFEDTGPQGLVLVTQFDDFLLASGPQRPPFKQQHVNRIRT